MSQPTDVSKSTEMEIDTPNAASPSPQTGEVQSANGQPGATAATSGPEFKPGKKGGDISATYSRDEVAKGEEEKGLISFQVIHNDGDPEHLMQLMNLKTIFSLQLPKMPKEYIVRLVLDRNHRSMCIMKQTPKGTRVVGGICFRPFYTQMFAEIVFLAITATEQVRGYGTRLMNHLKEHVKREHINYFLTYADNYAIGYFKKQGFTKQVSMNKAQWMGYIKDYDGGTLMECTINHAVNYLDIPGMIARQREFILGKVRAISKSHVVHTGLPPFETQPGEGGSSKFVPLDPLAIPGVAEAGWKPSARKHARVLEPSQMNDLQAKLGGVLKAMKNAKDAWPFQDPVDRSQVKDYYDIIKQPMDLRTMTEQLSTKQYTSVKDFRKDFMLIINNCRQYNADTTTYYRCANNLLDRFNQVCERYKVE